MRKSILPLLIVPILLLSASLIINAPTVSSSSTPFGDEFNTTSLDSRWTTVDPAGESIFNLTAHQSWLRITTSSPPGRDLWPTTNDYAPRILQNVTVGDFAIETKMSALTERNDEGGGLIVWSNSTNYLLLRRMWSMSSQEVLFHNGDGSNYWETVLPSNINPTLLKLIRVGNSFSGSYSSDGKIWTSVGNITDEMNGPIEIGLHTIHAFHTGTFSADFDYFKIESNVTEPLSSTITASCRSSTSYTNFKVEIAGNLTAKGIALSEEPILLSYSATGGSSWQNITLTNTGANGNFSAVWMPSFTGNYVVRATWAGNSTYPSANTEVSLAVIPFQQASVFSVTSNSTVSTLAFNSTNSKLSFNVSGPSGTKGFVDVSIAKSLVSDITDANVYLDGNQLGYTITSTSDSWILHFTYSHSTHSVVIDLGAVVVAEFPTAMSSILIMIAMSLVLILAKSNMRKPVDKLKVAS